MFLFIYCLSGSGKPLRVTKTCLKFTEHVELRNMPRGKKQHSKREMLFSPQWGLCWFHCVGPGSCQLGLMPNAKATMKINQNRDEALKKYLRYLINVIWLELFDWLWRQSQRHLESRLQTNPLASFRLPSHLLLKAFFISTPSLNSPSPRCPCPTAAPCSLMSGSVDALG